VYKGGNVFPITLISWRKLRKLSGAGICDGAVCFVLKLCVLCSNNMCMCLCCNFVLYSCAVCKVFDQNEFLGSGHFGHESMQFFLGVLLAFLAVL